MQIAEFQQWVKDTDRETQWELLTALQLVAHLTEEVGELARSVNRIYRRAGEKEKRLLNLRGELVDVFWFLVKIANKFDVDLEAEARLLVRRADEWPVEEYCGELVGSLRALDEELSAVRNDICPTIKYPDNAPVYLTATLVPDDRNILFPLVSEVRLALEGYLDAYCNEFGSTLSMAKFDERFLHNPALETIKYYFVLTFWTIFEHCRKVTLDLMQNDFSRLKNSDWLFSLCLVINKLLHKHPNYVHSSGYLGLEIINYVNFKGLMKQKDFDLLRKQENFQQANPDQLIQKLLSTSLQYNGVQVQRKIQYLLVAWKLRNFAGHNIQIQNVVASRFEDIVKVLMCDIFLLVEEY